MKPISILVVEDEAVVAMDIENTIVRLGYSLFNSVPTAEEALDLVQQNKPDLALCDIQLAGQMDGVVLSEKLINDFNIPVVFLTAHADVVTIERATNTGPFGYVVKPFQEKDLHVAIELGIARYEAEKNLRLALEKERELNQIKSRFFATALHDLKVPLTQIAFAAEILGSCGSACDPVLKERYVQRIESGIENIRSLLDNVLQLHRSESDRLAFNPQPVPIVQFCNNLIKEFQTIAGENLHIYLITNSPEEVIIQTDRLLLQRILSNLLSNAIKYSPDGGRINFNLNIQTDEVTFSIKDNGIGIPPETLAVIFNAFERGVNVKDIPGTGLGMVIVKMGVDACQGKITIGSTVNQGTEVKVTIPRTPKQTD
jgi:signal transduction histidine kinase